MTGIRLFLAATLPLRVLAQEFDVATVRPSPQSTSGAVSIGTSIGHGELKLTGATLQACIRRAYGVKDYQISGPDWIRTEHYDIHAKAASGTPDDQLAPMLRNLLMARFKLAFHRATRQMPAFALVVARNGPKIQPVPADGPARVFANTPGIQAEQVSMSRFADLIAAKVDRPVIDATALAGVFNIKLVFASGLQSDSDISVFSALQEQLGLRLESRQAPVEMFVVDHAEKTPVEN